MEYKLVFSTGYENDLESLQKQFKGDVLLLDEQNDNYYELNFVTLDRLKQEFDRRYICYVENNMVILHEITKENIIRSISELHKWRFYKQWVPLTQEQIEKYYYPREKWVYFSVSIPEQFL
ncbi:MAG: hypothetical protein J0H74_23035 [Chitinophagaceae bacterium]|nr:hypothetical protein [Chitinophagaceae bacterium]